MCEVKTCLECKKLIPCHKKAEKREMVICADFIDMYPDDDGTLTMEEIQALNASIPEDVIEPDYTGCEDDPNDVNPCEGCTLCGE